MRGKQLTSLALLIFCYLLPAYSQVLLRTIPSGSTTANGLAFDGEEFWVSDNTTTLRRIRYTDGFEMGTITAPVGSDGLGWDAEYLWTISRVSNRPWIYKMSPTTGTLMDSIPDLTNGQAQGMTWDSQDFWLSRTFPGDSLLRVDTESGIVLQRFATEGDDPRGVAFDGTNLWYSSKDSDADRIYRVNPTTGQTTWSFELPPHQTQPERRIKGITWANGRLWIVAYAQSNTQIVLHEYDVSNAVDPDIEVEQVFHDFGQTVFGNPIEWSFDVANIGNSELILDSAIFTVALGYTVTHPDFPATVAANWAREIEIFFDPPQAGVYNDTLTIYSNDPDEPTKTLIVTGVCLSDEGNIDINTGELDFGDVWIAIPGWSTSRILEIHNIGFGELTIDNVLVQLSNAYFMDPVEFPVVMAPQSMFTVRVWFDPDVPNIYEGFLRITSDDVDDPILDVAITGEAHAPEFEVGQSFWTFTANGDDFDNGINAVAGIEDVNGDGAPDVIACSGNGLTYCLNGTSSGIADTFWTFNTRENSNHSGIVYYDRALAIVPDLTGDDVDDVIIGTAGGSKSVYAISAATGEQLWMFDTRELDGTGAWVNAVRSPGDLNGDFINDVVCAIGSNVSEVIALSGDDGSLLWEGPDDYDSFYSVAVISDVTGDGIPDIVGGTVGDVVGINGATGADLWNASVSNGSPVFDLENMGNANPAENQSEDVVVASAYYGVFSIDGLDGDHNWIREITGTFLYQVAAGSDINGDDVREVYVGTTGGHLICMDGRTDEDIWNEIADDQSENILSLAAIDDITGDGIMDIACGTLGDYIVVMEGWDGAHIISTQGQAQSGPVDAVGVLPDIDGTSRPEVIAGNREGAVQALATGGESIHSFIAGLVSEFGSNAPIPNVRVWVTGNVDTVTTDVTGVYTFPIAPGTYSVNFKRLGYCTVTNSNVVVTADQTTQSDALLRQPNAHFSVTSMNIATSTGHNTSSEFEISNLTTPTICPVEYVITDNTDWLSVTPANGTIPNGGTQVITVTVDVSDLPAGDFDAVIVVTHNDVGSPTQIPVTLTVTLGADEENLLPTEFALYQNYPNPFNATTSLKFDLPTESHVKITMFDIMGREAAIAVNEVLPAGRHSYSFNAGDLPTGMYFVRMDSRDFTSIRKMVLIK